MKKYQWITLALLAALSIGINTQGQYIGTGRPYTRQESDNLFLGKVDTTRFKADSLLLKAVRIDTVALLKTYAQTIAGDSAQAILLLAKAAAADSAKRISGDSAQAALTSARGAIKDSLNADSLRSARIRSKPADSTGSGPPVSLTVGEAVTFGKLLYMKADGKLWQTNAKTWGDTNKIGVFISLGAVAADGAVDVFTRGFVMYSPWNWTVGKPIFQDTIKGGMTQTPDTTTSGRRVQLVGIAGPTADYIYFDPDATWLTNK